MTRALEIANASIVLEHDLPAVTRRPRAVSPVIDEARRLERLLAKRRKLRRDLRTVDADIKHSRRMLKALAGVHEQPTPTKGSK